MPSLIFHPPVQECQVFTSLPEFVFFCSRLSKTGAILADRQIASSHGALLQKSLSYPLIEVASAEKNKTRELKQHVEDLLIPHRLGRDALLIGVGGGVTTDLVGFLASTYMRGVPFALVPTTLLGMVDAAIGGKTGVDTPFGKNLIGSFCLPQAVLIHPPFLKTLPAREVRNGLAEILKYGLILNRKIWDLSEEWEPHLDQLIELSVACKMEVVQEDFLETGGKRRILNFGHTVGHALELLSHFKMPHGEAVALGCMAESYLSHLLGFLSEESLHKILARYNGYAFQPFSSRAFREALKSDKKTEAGQTRFVLLEEIGRCVPFGGQYCSSVPDAAIEKMIGWIHASQN